MKASIIICFYNRINLLPYLLDSLRTSAKLFNEVILADDGSDQAVVDEITALIKKYDFPIVHAWHPRDGARRAATRNNGIRAATGDYLIFADADLVLLPGNIKAHIENAEKGKFLIANCKYTTKEHLSQLVSEGYSDTLVQEIYNQISEERIIKESRRLKRNLFMRKLGLISAEKVTFGGHFSAFKQDIYTVNGYDESFTGWGGEDVDFSMRMGMAGFKGKSLIGLAKVLHIWHPSEMGVAHWKDGGNAVYLKNKEKKYFCENGIENQGRG
jgi:glycosyltransferase involved in cell wall biosynthesis